MFWEEADEDKQTALVGKIEPTGSTLVVPVEVKGPNDQYGCEKLKCCIKTHRIELLVCKSDQDNALVAKIEKVVDALRRDGFQEVLEQSPVGESQSNGIAERKIQAVEDLLRTMRVALQGRLKMQIPMRHPILRWRMDHVASVTNSYVVENDGLTNLPAIAWAKGRTPKLSQVCEKVLMQLRWRIGIYLGVAGHSEKHYIGTWTGDVVRTRSIVRVVEQARWNTDFVDRLLGTPARPTPSG